MLFTALSARKLGVSFGTAVRLAQPFKKSASLGSKSNPLSLAQLEQVQSAFNLDIVVLALAVGTVYKRYFGENGDKDADALARYGSLAAALLVPHLYILYRVGSDLFQSDGKSSPDSSSLGFDASRSCSRRRGSYCPPPLPRRRHNRRRCPPLSRCTPSALDASCGCTAPDNSPEQENASGLQFDSSSITLL